MMSLLEADSTLHQGDVGARKIVDAMHAASRKTFMSQTALQRVYPEPTDCVFPQLQNMKPSYRDGSDHQNIYVARRSMSVLFGYEATCRKNVWRQQIPKRKK